MLGRGDYDRLEVAAPAHCENDWSKLDRLGASADNNQATSHVTHRTTDLLI
jgi:hypothetical protein